MKIKEDIEKWMKELREIKGQVSQLKSSAELYNADVKILTKQVESLVVIAEGLSETILALVSQQIGD